MSTFIIVPDFSRKYSVFGGQRKNSPKFPLKIDWGLLCSLEYRLCCWMLPWKMENILKSVCSVVCLLVNMTDNVVLCTLPDILGLVVSVTEERVKSETNDVFCFFSFIHFSSPPPTFFFSFWNYVIWHVYFYISGQTDPFMNFEYL